MIIVDWPESVNTRFYAGTKQPKDNAETTEYASGRVAVHLANTRFNFTHNLTLLLTQAELKAFWSWFTITLGGLSGAFRCSAIGTGLYRFTETPSEGQGQRFRSLTLTIEEVY